MLCIIFKIFDALYIFHLAKDTPQSERRVQGNCEDFRSKHGIASGNLNIMKFYWFLFSNVQSKFPVSIFMGWVFL